MKVSIDYAQQSEMSDPGSYADAIRDLPGDVARLAGAVQGLCMHDFVAEAFYDFPVPEAARDEIHIRPVKALLDRLAAKAELKLGEKRPPEQRLAIRCRHYALLHIAFLRAKGVPSRLRGGFATYLDAPNYTDHWITEYWSAELGRWVLTDPQLDEVWAKKIDASVDPMNISRDQFVVAGDAWRMCRQGDANPELFGIMEFRGLWFIASSMVRDLAALNKIELLPWDGWGLQPGPDTSIPPEDLDLFDRLAALTSDPMRPADEVASFYAGEPRLRVGQEVFNAILMRRERV